MSCPNKKQQKAAQHFLKVLGGIFVFIYLCLKNNLARLTLFRK
jgi:hypothetical protein